MGLLLLLLLLLFLVLALVVGHDGGVGGDYVGLCISCCRC